ncbi:MAG: hypothetical protein MJ095_00170 [Oscillospiraceae bacterium]|nr:hypothetical protein [Oscillospiraceae bacterium]
MSTPIYDEFSPSGDFPVARAKDVWFSEGNGSVEDAIIYGDAEQLIPFPYSQSSGTTSQGANFTYDNNGIITINKSTSGTTYPQFFAYASDNGMNLVEGKKYTLSIEVVSGVGEASVYMANRKNDGSAIDLGRCSKVSAGMKKSVTFEYKKNTGRKDDIISVYTEKDAVCNNLVVKIVLEAGGAAHEFSPYNLSRIALRNDIEALKAR